MITLLAYITAVVLSFIAGLIATWPPLTVMHGMAGNHGSMWSPDPGNERRFYAAHNLGQGIGAFAGTLARLFVVLWVFTWFNRQPNMAFLILLSIWAIIASFGAKQEFRPVAQMIGTVGGLAVFFSVYVLTK